MGRSGGSGIHSKHRQRMRERIRRERLAALHPHEILEALLFFSVPQANTNPVAHTLLDRFGCLSNVLEASEEELQGVEGVGPSSAFLISFFKQLSDIYQLERQGTRPMLITVRQTKDYLRSVFTTMLEEEFYIICLNNNMELKSRKRIAKGTRCNVDANALDIISYIGSVKPSHVIFVHNHPGGTITPSRGDLESTAKLYRLLESFDVRLSDHYIVTSTHVVSLNMLGYDLATGELREITDAVPFEPAPKPQPKRRAKPKPERAVIRAAEGSLIDSDGKPDRWALRELEEPDEYERLSDYTYGYPDIGE